MSEPKPVRPINWSRAIAVVLGTYVGVGAVAGYDPTKAYDSPLGPLTGDKIEYLWAIISAIIPIVYDKIIADPTLGPWLKDAIHIRETLTELVRDTDRTDKRVVALLKHQGVADPVPENER